MTGASPTARQRELGIRLRALRNEHGMTVEEVAISFFARPPRSVGWRLAHAVRAYAMSATCAHSTNLTNQCQMSFEPR